MATFNENILQDYYNSRDYNGAANYIKQFKPKDRKSAESMNNTIKDLQRRAAIQSTMYSNMDMKQQDAFNFISAVDGNGTIPKTSWGSNYTSKINNLIVNDGVLDSKGNNVGGTRIEKLRLEFTNDNVFKAFCDNSGIDINEYKRTGKVSNSSIKFGQDSRTGRKFAYFNTTDLKMAHYINAADKSIKRPAPYEYIFSEDDVTAYDDDISVKGLDAKGNIYNNSRFNYSNIKDARKLVNDAREIQQKALDEQQTKTIDEQMYVSPFLGQGHANAYNKYQKGLITIDDYNKITKKRTEAYNRLLAQHGFGTSKIYSAIPEDDEEAWRFKEVDNKKGARDYVTKTILAAMQEDRITYSAAMHNGEVGTYITIGPKLDSKGNEVDGDLGKTRRYFVPGLFKSSAEETFNRDTKQMAVRDNADMQRWNYGKFLQDGNYVGYDKSIGSYKLGKDKNGKEVKVPISKDEMLSLLNRDNIVNNAARTLSAAYNNEGKVKTRLVKGVPTPIDVKGSAKLFANVGTDEIMPDDGFNYEDRVMLQNDLYNDIMKILNEEYLNAYTNN